MAATGDDRKNVEICRLARELGYLSIPDGLLVKDLKALERLRPELGDRRRRIQLSQRSGSQPAEPPRIDQPQLSTVLEAQGQVRKAQLNLIRTHADARTRLAVAR